MALTTPPSSAKDPGAPSNTIEPLSAQVYWISVCLGFALLLTYNFTLNLITFFADVYADAAIGYFVALALTYPSLAVQVFMLTVGDRVPAYLRIRASLLTNSVVLILLVTAAPPAGRTAGLALMAVSGLATAVLEASLFGFLSQLGREGAYSQAAMAGAGAAGLVAALLQISIRGALPERQSALLYAAIGVSVLLGSVVAHVRLESLPEVRRVFDAQPAPAAASQAAGDARLEAQSPLAVVSAANAGKRLPLSVAGEAPPLESWEDYADEKSPSATRSSAPASGAAVDFATEDRGGSKGKGILALLVNLARVARVVVVPAAAVFTQFVATFLVFPGVTAQVAYKGADSGTASAWFSILILVFSTADVAGRSFAARHAALSDAALVLYALSRFMWAPLVAACAFNWAPGFNDAAIVCIMLGFGFTNGHVASLGIMCASKARPRDRELAGMVLVACLHFGIVGGSNLALVFDK